MNPFDFIAGLKIDPNERISLMAVMEGKADVARVDLFKKHDSPENVKESFLKVGLHFCNLVKTSGRPGHICGMAVARTQDLAFQFKIANEKGDRETMKALTDYEPMIPPPEAKKGDHSCLRIARRNISKSPMPYLELIFKSQRSFAI